MNTLKKKNVRIVIMLVLVGVYALILIFFPGSVSNNGDITEKLLVVTVGLDKSEDGLLVSGLTLVPVQPSGEGGQAENVAVSASGRSIRECLMKIQEQSGKSVDLGLCGAIVIGEELAQSGVDTLLEIILSSTLVSPGAFLVQADGMSAEQLIHESAKLTDSSATVLTQLLKEAQDNTGVIATTLLKFLSESKSKSRSSFMPLVKTVEVEKSGGSGGGSSQSGGSDKKYRFESVEKMSAYNEGKAIGKLDVSQSSGLTWSDKHVNGGVVIKEHFTVLGTDIGTVSAELVGRKFSMRVDFDGDRPTADISVEATFQAADRERLNQLSIDGILSVKQMAEAYETNFSEEIERQISSAVDFCKQNGCDLFFIEQNLYRYKTKKYREFSERGGNVLSDCEVSVKAKVELL